jgi:hypothetical protein
MDFRELMLEQKRLILDTSHLSESRNAVLGREIIDVPVKTDTPQSATPCTTTWTISDVSKVRSLEAEGFITTFIKSNWSTVRNGWQNVIKDLKDPKKGIENDKDIWKSISDEEKQILLNFTDGTTTDPQISPWNYVIKNLADGTFEPQEYVYTLEGHKKSIARHNEMLSKLKNAHLGSFKTVLNQFKDILCTYNKDGIENGGFISVLLKYKIEIGASDGNPLYNRFDEFFKDDTTKKILDKINELYKIRITPAELKALQMKETGDYTNLKIAGITGKQKGITNAPDSSGTGIVGMCQLPSDSADEAVKWAFDNVKITIDKDRAIPKNAVYLTAAYFGRSIELVGTATLDNVTDCLHKKVIIFGSYNGGFESFKLAIQDFITKAKKEKKSTDIDPNTKEFLAVLDTQVMAVYKKRKNWTETRIKAKQKEIKEYMVKIPERLTLEN